MEAHFFVVLILVLAVGGIQAGRSDQRNSKDEPLHHATQQVDTTWVVLVAGSSGYGNYRHQADVCHAYQLLKRGGLKDENIVVFMYDDIAKNRNNPRPGTVINHPKGGDVYAGVPKDYTGRYVTAQNLYAVILGNKTAVKGGSGKVVNSKPNDRIFIYYTDHGSPGLLGMPNLPHVYAKDFIKVLKTKHALGTYKEMVIYIEACEAGSLFEGLLLANMNIYAVTASNAEESSYATYCPGGEPAPPPGFDTCLGDLYSVAWMEDSDTHNRKIETLKLQYQSVKERTSVNHTYEEGAGSHVMEYGDKTISPHTLHMYQGFDPSFTAKGHQGLENLVTHKGGVNQRDADIHFLWHRYKNSNDGSKEKTEILREIKETMKHRIHLDGSMKLIGVLLFGPRKGKSTLNSVRSSGSPLVDDWECLKSMVRSFETHCGSLTQYGMKHTRAFANLCNNGVSNAAMEEASMNACSGHDLGQWDPSKLGYSA